MGMFWYEAGYVTSPALKFGLVMPIPLVILSTGYRLWTQLYMHRAKIAVDDLLMIWATLVFLAQCSIPVYDAFHPIQTLQEEPWRRMLWYVFLHTYAASTAATKLPILALYHRTFPVPTFRLLVIITAAMVISWQIANQIALGNFCRPIHYFWTTNAVPENTAPPGACFNIWHGCVYHGTTNLFFDLLIFLLPTPRILKLRMSCKSKALVGGLFTIGLVACGLCAYRLGLYLAIGREHPVRTDLMMLFLYEPLCSILCANFVVTYKPFAAFCRRILRIPSPDSTTELLQDNPNCGHERKVQAKLKRRTQGMSENWHWMSKTENNIYNESETMASRGGESGGSNDSQRRIVVEKRVDVDQGTLTARSSTVSGDTRGV